LIVFLGALALIIILSLGDVPQESSQDVSQALKFGLLERQEREAGMKRKSNRRRNKKRKESRKGKNKSPKKKGQRKSKSNQKEGLRKSKNNRKEGLRKSKKNQNKDKIKKRKLNKANRKKSGKGKGKGKEKGKTSRRNNKKDQSKQRLTSRSDVPAADVKQVFQGYVKGTNRLRQVKRIIKWLKTLDKKKAKAATDFTLAIKALDIATANGTTCGGAVANASIAATVGVFNNCPVSAADHCTLDVTVPQNELDTCEAILETSVSSTKDWLLNPSITTFPNVTYPNQTCVDFAATYEPIVKAAKDYCVSSSEIGSFGNCSSILKEVPSLIYDCGIILPDLPIVPTSAPPGRQRIFKFKQQQQKFF